MTGITQRVIDFSEPGKLLRRAGKRIGRFATVHHNNYAGVLTPGSLLYSVIVGAGPQAVLCIEAHTLAFDWFGVRASLCMGRDQALCAAWTFSDACRSPLDLKEQALCIRCLQRCAEGACPQHDVEITQIPLARLTAAVIDWTRRELPPEAYHDRRPPA